MRQKHLCIVLTLSAVLLVLSAATSLAASQTAMAPPPGGADRSSSPLEGTDGGARPPLYALQATAVLSPLTFVKATIGEPQTLDPHWMYETAGAEVVQQVYEPLIFFDRERTDQFVPVLAIALPQVSADATVYTFTVRQGVKFHEGGNLTPSDVAYSFWRGMLQDRTDGPGILILEPLTGYYAVDDIAYAMGDEAACEFVKSTVTYDNTNWTVTFHPNRGYGPMMQLFASPWGSVVDKEWMAANGDWAADCFNWRSYHDPPAGDSLLYDRMNGTGPFKFDSWASPELTLVRNEDYWRTEPMWDHGPSGLARLQRVVFKLEPDWPTRLAMLADGEADSADIFLQDIAQVGQLVRDEYDGGEIDPSRLTVLNVTGTLRSFRNLPTVYSTDGFFMYDINSQSPYIGSGQLDGSGVPTDFFADIHVRKAFNYCFDWDRFINDACGGEAEQRRGPIARGVMGYDPAQAVYTHSLSQCEAEFQQAWGGEVWTHGLSMTLAYNEYNVQRQVGAEILRDNVESITDSFHITVVGVPWEEYLDARRNLKLPLHFTGWMQDFSHPHNWVVPYMHSSGAFASRQHFPQHMRDLFDDKIDSCVALIDPGEAEVCYKELQAMAYEYAIDIFGVQPFGRHYEQLWVDGYYHNPAHSGPYYFYAIAKSVLAAVSGAEEGSLIYTDTNGLPTILEIPAGAVTSTTEIRYTPLPAAAYGAGPLVDAAHAFELTAVMSDSRQLVTSVDKPYTVTVSYDDGELDTAIEDTLALYYWDGNQWVKEPSSTVDPLNNTVQATPSHFSSWALLGETRRVFLPLVVKNY